MVTTVFVANAFLDYFDKTGEEEHLTIAMASCDFILEHLILFEEEDTLCFGYIPGEKARVYNANMLGAALLARIYHHTKDRYYLEKSRKAMVHSVGALTKDYFWPEFKNLFFQRQQQFAREITRVGKQYFVQTPNRYFPIESHTWLPIMGWLPRPMLIPVLHFTNRVWIKKTRSDWHLLSKYELSQLFPDSTVFEEKLMELTKSIIAIRASSISNTAKR